MSCERFSTQLTDAQKSQILGILAVGCDRQTAADYTGCLLADLRNHLQSDRQFLSDVCHAEAGVEVNHMRNVHAMAMGDKKDWRASVWWLERRSPERYGRRTAGDVTSRQLKAFIAILVDALETDVHNAEDRDRIIARLQSLSASVEQMLRDAQPGMSEIFDAACLFEQAPDGGDQFDFSSEGLPGSDCQD